MSFAHGHHALAIPGPSPVPEAVLRAMHRPSEDVYGEALLAVSNRVLDRLSTLSGGAARVTPYIGNGHAGWEAANANLFSRGDRALVLATGTFGHGWASAAAGMGIEVEVMDFGTRAPADPQRLRERLAADREGRIRAVLVTQVDTASSVRSDLPALRAAMEGHDALLAVDAIAALGCEPMAMADWGIDVLVAASQKGLMAPPGLAFVWQSARAAALPRTDLATSYWDWNRRAGPGQVWQYWGGTPPAQLIHAMDEALRLLLEGEGLAAAHARHEGLARAVWAAFEAWDAPGLSLNVSAPEARARSVTAAFVPGADALRAWMLEKAGVTLGIGLGAERPADALRVAHMGHISAHGLLGTLAVMEAGMTALGIPHGRGALDAAVAAIAARA